MEQKPPTNFEPSPLPPPPDGEKLVAIVGFILALVFGSSVSGLLWHWVWTGAHEPKTLLEISFTVVIAKFAMAAFFLNIPRGRAAGIGLLVSVAVGFMIFFSNCSNRVFH
jgi:hypothetical protein